MLRNNDIKNVPHNKYFGVFGQIILVENPHKEHSYERKQVVGLH